MFSYPEMDSSAVTVVRLQGRGGGGRAQSSWIEFARREGEAGLADVDMHPILPFYIAHVVAVTSSLFEQGSHSTSVNWSPESFAIHCCCYCFCWAKSEESDLSLIFYKKYRM